MMNEMNEVCLINSLPQRAVAVMIKHGNASIRMIYLTTTSCFMNAIMGQPSHVVVNKLPNPIPIQPWLLYIHVSLFAQEFQWLSTLTLVLRLG